MSQKFLNTLEDCDWLRTTHLNHTLHEFRSFILHGNEDDPAGLDLYTNRDPSYLDPYWEVTKDTEGEWAWVYVDEQEAYNRWEATKNVDQGQH